MSSLRILDLSDNKLESLPQNMNLLRLEHLDLSNNLFAEQIPPSRQHNDVTFEMMPSLLELAARSIIYHR